MFSNQIDPIVNQSDIVLSHHTPWNLKWSRFNSNEKVIIYSIVIFGAYLTIDNFYHTFLERKEKEAYIENPKRTVPKYYSILKNNECAHIIEDEHNFRKLGFHCVENDSLAIIKEV